MADGDHDETLEEFKSSFAYGSRNDLSFKFLKKLSAGEAGEFFRQVLHQIGELYDGAGPEALIDLAYEWQVKAYRPHESEKRPFVYEDRPFTHLAKPLSETVIGLVNSAGQFVSDHDPAPFGVPGMTQEDAISRIDDFLKAPAELTEIPRDVPIADIAVRHPGYDVRSVARDPAVALPRDLLIEAEKEGRIGRLADRMFSFVGACSQLRLRRDAGAWVERWREAGIEALFLVPV